MIPTLLINQHIALHERIIRYLKMTIEVKDRYRMHMRAIATHESRDSPPLVILHHKQRAEVNEAIYARLMGRYESLSSQQYMSVIALDPVERVGKE